MYICIRYIMCKIYMYSISGYKIHMCIYFGNEYVFEFYRTPVCYHSFLLRKIQMAMRSKEF